MSVFRMVIVMVLMVASIAGSSAQTLKDMLVAQDKQIYDAIAKGDAEAFRTLLTGDSIVVYGADIISKQDMLKQFSVQKSDPNWTQLTGITFDDAQAYSPSPNTAILTYKSKRDVVDSAGKHTTYKFRESTVFVKKNGKWLSAFHAMAQIQPPAQ